MSTVFKILISILVVGTTVFATLVLSVFAFAMSFTGYQPLAIAIILLLAFMWADVVILIYFLKEDKWD